jgi:hypothetical protein
MKSVTIKGKHNIDKLAELENEGYQAVRKSMLALNSEALTHKPQLEMLIKLYMNCEFDLKSLLQKELEQKIHGYKGQDLRKEIHEGLTLIKLEEVLEKLVTTKLTCGYCSQPVFLFYKNVREPTQWTLDRIDNALSHTKENTCISCLKCNLQRRLMHVDKFTFTKKLKINKV